MAAQKTKRGSRSGYGKRFIGVASYPRFRLWPELKRIPDAIKPHYDWPVDDIPSASVYGDDFTVDHSMICKLGATVLLLSVTAS